MVSQIIVSYGAGDDLPPDGEQFFNIIEGDVQVEQLIIIFNFSLVLLLENRSLSCLSIVNLT